MRTQLLAVPLAALVSLVVSASSPGTAVRLDGYAEFRRAPYLVVEGQRVTADASTRFKGRGVRALDEVALGSEVKVQGVRLPGGVVLASSVEVRENGFAFLEREVLAASDQAESAWVGARMMFTEREDGSRVNVGEIEERGPRAARARRVLDRLVPPYVDPSRLRVRVVRNAEWNAAAMGNGSLWVYSGLMDALHDEELAVVLGHELAHYTHEHTRRQVRRDIVAQLVLAGAVAGTQAIDNGKLRAATTLGALLTGVALASGYSRDQEDQADRVGLRYVHEAGYSVDSAPAMWRKFQRKHGDGNRVVSFFLASHSRPGDRVRNAEREIALNYSAW